MIDAQAGPVLVVDDDEDIRDLIRMLLLNEGYEVLHAPNGRAALNLLSDRPPRLILLDMRMPVMDGPSFAEAYRQQPGPHVPIVVLTAARDAAVSAREINADGYLAKPFDLSALLAIVRRYAQS